MAEDFTIGVAIFIAFVLLAMIGRRFGWTVLDIWSAA